MSKALDRLSKLIAHADNASTEAERVAFLEKAQEMSAIIGIELSVARAHAADKEREKPVSDVEVKINSFSAKPIHRQAMADLFLAISDAHDIKCTISHSQIFIFCYGFQSDIELTQTLFGVLSLQMVKEADDAIRRGEQKWILDEVNKKIGIDGRVYRRLFYEGFTKRVAGRLYEARKQAIKTSDETVAGTELVLRDKAKEVNDFFEEETKHLSLRGVYRGLNNSDTYAPDAKAHGSSAADRANLGLHNFDLDETKRGQLA